jgi:hypothetical protein
LRYLLLITAVASIALFAFAGSSLADPSDLFTTPVPPHRHFVQSSTGALVPVGPQICEHPELQKAFNQFHHNVHHSFVPPDIVVHTLGPQNGAPGLHNGRGAELVARLCSFTG